MLLASVLAALPVAYASYSELDERLITKRDVQYGGKCGIQGNNAACAAGLCCSQEGLCGTEASSCAAPWCQFHFSAACDTNQKPEAKVNPPDVPRPLFGDHDIPYGAPIFNCKIPGKIALTFDDGPIKSYTNDLLDVLKKNNVKATFFVVGTNNGKGQIEDPRTEFPKTILRMLDDGHQIGSHSWSHEDFTKLSAEERHAQITKNEVALVDIMGFFPTYMRVPYSGYNNEIHDDLKAYGYHNVEFGIDTHDSEPKTSEPYKKSRDTFSSSLATHDPANTSFIVVAHDIQEETVHGFAQFMIDEAKKYKYELVTVGECLGDHSNNWYREKSTGQEYQGPAPKKPQGAGDASSVPSPPTPTQQPSLASTAGTVSTAATGNPPKATEGSSTSSPSPGAPTGTTKPSLARRDIPTSNWCVFFGLVILTRLL